MLPASLSALPPWLVLAALIGVMSAAMCFTLFGKHWSRLAWYAVLGILAATLAQIVGTLIGAPQPLKIGDLNVLAASLGASVVVASARLGGL
jgi:uncharacterized membrane protein